MSLTPKHIEILELHIQDVKEQIISAANKEGGDGPIDIPQLGNVMARYARTRPIPPVESAWAQIIGVPGIIWIAALLALIFGILTVWYPDLADIAKVLAGAIVGASGVTATAGARK